MSATSNVVKPANAKQVLLIGATSGLGEAIALKYASLGIKTIACGRRQDKLDALAKDNDHIDTVQWDVSKLKDIPARAKEIADKFPELHSVWIIAGLQRSSPFDRPQDLKLDDADLEVLTNLTSPIHLLAAWLPILSKRRDPSITIVSSSLGLLPAPRTPVYNATVRQGYPAPGLTAAQKAGLHQMILSIRQQFAAAQHSVTLCEVYPPAVKTELHDTRNQPDLPGVEDYGGMEIDDFMKELWQGLEAGKLDIPVGQAVDQFERIDGPRREMMAEAAKKK